MAGGVKTWPIEAAWVAAVEVSAAAFAADPHAIRAPSRGRGPRPPKSVWEAKRWAVLLTVMLSGCGYSELAAHLKLNKDTVCSHCAKAREACAADDEAAATCELLLGSATVRLRALAPLQEWQEDAVAYIDPEAGFRAKIEALEIYLAGIIAQARQRLSDEADTASSDSKAASSDKPQKKSRTPETRAAA